MKLINLTTEPDRKDWSMQFMDESHFDSLLVGDCRVNKPDGSPLMVVVRGALSPEAMALGLSVLRKINLKTFNRSVASGINAVPMKKLDGSMSKTTQVPKGWEVTSGILGFFERQIRMPYCHPCAWNAKRPQEFSKLFPVLRECSSHFEKNVPDRFSVQRSFVDKTHSDFVIPGTVYTTITVNKNFRTACHKDVGDLGEGFSNMFVIREGVYSGGVLVLPDWRIGVDLGHGDLVMFDAHEFHGNTQLVTISKGATRTSVVMYYREKMIHCKSMPEELEFAKNRKPGDALT